MNLNADFAFTQGSLGDYAECARRFELRYIKRLRYPALEVNQALEYEMRLRRGDRFHKLVQQHLLGVPAELLARSLADDADLAGWWETYLRHGLADLPTERRAEITLQTMLGGQRLLAKYDLLALEPGRGRRSSWIGRRASDCRRGRICRGGCRRWSIATFWRGRGRICMALRQSRRSGFAWIMFMWRRAGSA